MKFGQTMFGVKRPTNLFLLQKLFGRETGTATQSVCDSPTLKSEGAAAAAAVGEVSSIATDTAAEPNIADLLVYRKLLLKICRHNFRNSSAYVRKAVLLLFEYVARTSLDVGQYLLQNVWNGKKNTINLSIIIPNFLD